MWEVGGRFKVGRCVYLRWSKADVWQKPAQHCKAYSPIKYKLRYIHCKGSNQSILKEISPGCSLEGLMLKLKLQYFGHLMWRADSFEETLVLGRLRAEGEGDDRGWDGWMASPTQWTWVWVDSGSWWWAGRPGVLRSCGHKESDMTERLNWYT